MSATWATFTFKPDIAMGEVEATLRLAVIATEALHGEARVQAEAQPRVEPRSRTCAIAVVTDVGATLATIFGGYVRREFGEDAVNVHLPQTAAADPAGSRP
jgi:hypothetical protein